MIYFLVNLTIKVCKSCPKDSNLPIKKMTIENLDKNKIFTKSVTKEFLKNKRQEY